MNDAIATGVASGAVAIAGTYVAYRNRDKDSADKRLELLLTAHHALVEDLHVEREDLLNERIELRRRVTSLEADLEGLKSRVQFQNDMFVMLRDWIREIMAWVHAASQTLHRVGVNVAQPPPLPINLDDFIKRS